MRQTAMLAALVALLWGVAASAAVQGREVDYRAKDGTVLKGYLAMDPDLAGPRPGVLVVTSEPPGASQSR